jgi:hypothetical protein
MITLEVSKLQLKKKNVLKTTNSLIAHAALPVMLLINILGVKCCLPCLLDVVMRMAQLALPSQKAEGS